MSAPDRLAAAIARGAEFSARRAERRATMRRMHFDTIAVHGVYDAAEAARNRGSIIEPAYLSTAQHHPDADEMEAALAYQAPSWSYARIANPTSEYLEETLALLETYQTGLTASACATASGMAAIFLASAPLLARQPGRPRPNIVVSARCYGGTFQLFEARYAAEWDVEVRWVADPLDLAAWANAIDEHTRFVFGELPSNPSAALLDIGAVATLAHAAGVPLLIDSTLATPALLRPLGLGADLVIHSLTKAIGGSGLAVGGALIARHDLVPGSLAPEAAADYATWCKLWPGRDYGASLGAGAALSILSDLRSLRGRVDVWSRSAARIAAALDADPRVVQVLYPGLSTHPGHALAARDFWLVDGDADGQAINRFGHLLGFVPVGGPAVARSVFDALELIWRATDLGRIKSVATMPAISTHQQQGPTARRLADIPDGLIRLSVGGEHPDDLLTVLDRALAQVR